MSDTVGVSDFLEKKGAIRLLLLLDNEQSHHFTEIDDAGFSVDRVKRARGQPDMGLWTPDVNIGATPSKIRIASDEL